MIESAGAVRQIAWRELFPWLILLRTFRIAISPPLLAIATAAVLIVPLGWSIGWRVFLTEAQRETRLVANDVVPTSSRSQIAEAMPLAPRSYFPVASTALLEAYFDLSEPLKRFFQLELTLGEAAYYAFGFLWTLAVWAFPGGMITRRAVVQLATEEPPGIRPAAVYAGKRYLWYFLAPLYPLVGVVLLSIPIALLGLLLRLHTGFGMAVAGVCWVFVLALGLAAMWLFGGLIFGWPLMWPTISAERDGDPFEAFSRSYSYVYGKPLHYFFYVVVAAAFGALCWGVVSGAAMIVQEFGFWALSWGGGGSAVAEARQQALDFTAGEWVPHDHGRLWGFGTRLMGLWLGLAHAVASAFRFTFFFTAAAAIYLLLRQDVDEKQIDEVFIETDAAPHGVRPAGAQGTGPVVPPAGAITPPLGTTTEQS